MLRLAGRRRAALAILTAASLALVGCNDDGEASDDPTTTTRPATTTTTEPEDPFGIPDEIDEPYVQRVLDELYRIQGDALRRTVEVGLVDEGVLELLGSVYVEQMRNVTANQFSQEAISGFPEMKRPPGDTNADVEHVLSASVSCVFVEVVFDFAAVSNDPIDPQRSFLALHPTTPEQAAAGNPTPWAIAAEGFNQDGSVPEDPCAG